LKRLATFSGAFYNLFVPEHRTDRPLAGADPQRSPLGRVCLQVGLALLAGAGVLIWVGWGLGLEEAVWRRLALGGAVALGVSGWLCGFWLFQSENQRLRAARRLAVQYTTARVLSEESSLNVALPKILQAICESLGWPVGGMWQVDPRSNSINCVEVWHAPSATVKEFELATRGASMPPGVDLPGRVWSSGEPTWIRHLAKDANFPRTPFAEKVGLHSGLGFPIRHGQRVMGMMEFFSEEIQQPDAALLDMLAAIGRQIGQFIERQRMEAALRDSEALYHSLVDTLPISVLRKDLDGKVTFGNRHYCETLGRPLQELLGKTDFDLFPERLAEKYVADDRKVVKTREVFEDVERHQTPDGRNLYVHVLKAPVYDAHGEVVGTQVIFWDETARKQAEEDLQRTAAELTRSNRELEQFAYVASHDLQEPLRMVASYTQLLARRYHDQLDSAAQEYIRFAVSGATRMAELINDLLAFSRVGTKGKPFAPVACEAVLADALANLKVTLAETGAEITHAALPTVMADAGQLAQLFQNLLSNALKFRGPEPPRVHVQAEPQNGEWVFSVRDNGMGIEPQYFDRIFVIFQRLHTRDEYPGTGIGLALCKKIVERHGGRIWVESESGRGSTFRFSLPMRLA
jgi:PAS domain S-box-containing protein